MSSLSALKNFLRKKERLYFSFILKEWIQNARLNKYKFISYGRMNIIYRLYFTTSESQIINSAILRIKYFDDPDFNQDFCTERKLLKLFNDHKFDNFPKVYFCNAKKNIIPYLYSIMEDIHGISLSQENTINDYYNIGKVLSSVHNIKSNYFGKISNNHSISNANEYYTMFYNNSLILMKKFDDNLYRHFNQILNLKYNSHYMEYQCPSLLHGDFHPGNIIINQNFLPIFIDWESSGFGIKEYDIIKMKYFLFNRLSYSKLKSFMEGYSFWSNISVNSNFLIFELCWLIRMYLFDCKYPTKSSIYPSKEYFYKNIQKIFSDFDGILEQYHQNQINILKGNL